MGSWSLNSKNEVGPRAPAYMDISNPESGKAKGGKRFQLEHTSSFDILLYWTFYEQNNNLGFFSILERKKL